MPSSIAARLFLVAAVLIFLALVGAGAVTGLFLYRFVQVQVDQRLDAQIGAISSALSIAPDHRLSLAPHVDTPPFDRPSTGWYFEVIDGGSRIRSRSLGSSDLHVPGPWFLEWLTRPAPNAGPGARPEPKDLRIRNGGTVIGDHVVTIIAAAPRSAIWRPLFEALSPVLLALALAGIALVLAMLAQVRFGLRPLRALRTDVADVRAGRRDVIPGEQPSEIAPLVTELNTLIADNVEGLARARRHVSNLAHGLKTPLANLAAALDEHGRDPTGQLRDLIAQMDRRIRHHLGRARAAAQHGPVRARTLLVERVADLLSIVPKIHPGKSLDLAVDVDSQIALACEAQDLDEMLGNLVDNAAKWASSHVRVSAKVIEDDVAILVEDDGPGLSNDQIPAALQPGRRLDEAAPGFGFGLSITRELAELYGGSLELHRSGLGGVKARLTLPAAR